MQRIIYILVALGLLIHLIFAGNLMINNGDFYIFTLPHFLLLIGGITTLVFNFFQRKTLLIWVAIIQILLLLASWYWAMHHWPGGNDGPGLAWYFLIGGASLISAILGTLLLLLAYQAERNG